MNQVKRIKFFTFYGCKDEGKRRDNSPAADTKIDYIVSTLNRCGYGVDIISKASGAESHFISASVKTEGKNTYRYFGSFARTTSPLRIVYRWFIELQFFIWCLLNLVKGEQIIVYHSLGYDATFLKLRKLKSIRIIGEIEEIYQDVGKQSIRKCRNEYKFIYACEKYIFPTQLLDQKINTDHKPSLVVYGVYDTENLTEEKFSDGKIHVVYGGTLDPNKGGAIAAATAAAAATAGATTTAAEPVTYRGAPGAGPQAPLCTVRGADGPYSPPSVSTRATGRSCPSAGRRSSSSGARHRAAVKPENPASQRS